MDAVEKPMDRDKATAAAYLRMIGHTQEEAASGAGVGRRTLARWEKCSWWGDVCEEAADRWLNDLKQEARRTLSLVVRSRDGKLGDGLRALQVLERTDKRLLPPAQRHELTGEDGGPIEYRELSDEDLQERASQLKNRLNALSPSGNGDRPS